MTNRILFTAGLLAVLTVPQISNAETVHVATKESAVRKDCRFFAPVAVKVYYGDPMEVLSKEGDWLRIKFEDTEGCVHQSAITEKKIKPLKKRISGESDAEGSDATKEEVALAGKGFNPTVEKRYREENPELDFDTVDSIEEFAVGYDSLEEFIVRGGLKYP